MKFEGLKFDPVFMQDLSTPHTIMNSLKNRQKDTQVTLKGNHMSTTSRKVLKCTLLQDPDWLLRLCLTNRCFDSRVRVWGAL
jgi:hypothetical protein